MTTRPSIKTGRSLLPGVVAVGLFTVLAYVFWTAPFTGRDGFPRGFPGSESITENIGYLLFNLVDLATIDGEGFLVAFIVIAIVLDAALEGGVFLAKRESEGSLVTALRTEREPRADGGTVADAAGGTDTADAAPDATEETGTPEDAAVTGGSDAADPDATDGGGSDADGESGTDAAGTDAADGQGGDR